MDDALMDGCKGISEPNTHFSCLKGLDFFLLLLLPTCSHTQLQTKTYTFQKGFIYLFYVECSVYVYAWMPEDSIRSL